MYIKLLVDGSPSGDVIQSNSVTEGHARWFPKEKPTDPNPIQEYVEGTPVGDVDNGFHQTWTLQNKTFSTSDEETAANTLNANIQWEVIRSERKHRLDMTVYRQALRDITNQSDPFDITWPTKPDGYA